MREITVPVKVKIGKLTEIGLHMTMTGVSGESEDKPGRTYTANPSIAGTALSISAHHGEQHAYARTDFRDLVQAVWAELDKELDGESTDV